MGSHDAYDYHINDSHFAPISYYPDKLKIARSHGYNSVYSFFKAEYEKHRSTRKLAELSEMSRSGVRYILKKMDIQLEPPGFPTNK